MRKLRLEEVFVGAWVHQYRAIPKQFSPPMKVTGVFGDGDLYLEVSPEQGDPFDGSLSDTFGLPIDDEVLEGFGFVEDTGRKVWIKMIGTIRLIVGLKEVYGRTECRRVSFGGGLVQGWNEEIRCVHEMQRWWVDKVLLPFGIPLDLEWKGVEGGLSAERKQRGLV